MYFGKLRVKNQVFGNLHLVLAGRFYSSRAKHTLTNHEIQPKQSKYVAFACILAFSAALSIEKTRKLASFDVAPFMAVCDDTEEKDDAQENQQPEEGVDIEIPPEELFVSPEEDAKWERQKEQCSFCRSFLLSPCAQQFKYWSKCVEVAKSREIDYISACQRYTKPLMECSAEHQEYFAALDASKGKNDDVNDLDDKGEAQVQSSTPDSEVKADVVGNSAEAEGESQ